MGFATASQRLPICLASTLPTVSALLGHAAGGATAKYIARVDAVLIAAADKVSGEVSRMMGYRTSATVIEHPDLKVAH
jgi:hypothetical protein